MNQMFLIGQDKELIPMREQAYDNEAMFQKLLADYPDVLAGEQESGRASRRWLLIAREAGIPDGPGAYDRWALDHLFVDQDGMPTLVEVKRRSDTRVRREVVGQMLDYAANALTHWAPGTLERLFEERLQLDGVDKQAVLNGFLEGDEDLDGLWQKAAAHLEAPRLRLVFVADEIPPELEAIVRFLNDQMARTEVLAVEVKLWSGPSGKPQMLAPRVIGNTATAREAKLTSRRDPRQWEESSFIAELAGGSMRGDFVRRCLAWAQAGGADIRWGRGSKFGTVGFRFPARRAEFSLFGIWTNGSVEIVFRDYGNVPPFDSDDRRQELLDRLNRIAGIHIPFERLNSWTQIDAAPLESAAATDEFLRVMDWALEQIHNAGGSEQRHVGQGSE